MTLLMKAADRAFDPCSLTNDTHRRRRRRRRRRAHSTPMSWLGLGFGLGLRLDTVDRKLGLYSRQSVRVMVRVSYSRHGALL